MLSWVGLRKEATGFPFFSASDWQWFLQDHVARPAGDLCEDEFAI